jgi:hypothetical protein
MAGLGGRPIGCPAGRKPSGLHTTTQPDPTHGRPWTRGSGNDQPMGRKGYRHVAVVTMKQLLEAGVHFGHQTRRWNP